MLQKSEIIPLEEEEEEEVLCQADIVSCSIVLLKNPVISTQARALSHEGRPLATSPHGQPLFEAPAQPEALLFH